ncbi:hypothetical protein CcaverHIS631_0102190 [Cutaneotrichosporon cavernicola]|nr:hypothetical protein CcaverHIS631_0102190 [Cutaneotrichosporon cavernicola]
MASLLPLLVFLTLTTAADVDADRIGTLQATLPLRYVDGRTLVTPGLGTLPQSLPLVLSPDVGYLTAVGHCTTCRHSGAEYDVASSTTAHVEAGSSFNLTLAGRTGNASETLTLGGMIVQDVLYAQGQRLQLPAGVCNIRKIMSITNTTGGASSLPDGVSGHWGLGFNESQTDSLFPAACPPNGSITVGFDLKNTSAPAGDMHWGGVPPEAYEGRFNWLPTSASTWAIPIDGFQVGSTKINANKSSTAVLDPGLDGIFVPLAFAEALYAPLGGVRDRVYTERWNLPCNTTADVHVRLGGVSYALAINQLVVPRDRLGRTCWGSVVSWSNASIPETNGDIRLGKAFISGIYMALSYCCDKKERHVGLAGKPHSANPTNVHVSTPSINIVGVVLVICQTIPITYVATQYPVTVAPVAPVTPVMPVAAITSIPTHSAQPWISSSSG